MHIVTYICAALAAVVLVLSFLGANGAPQEAAGAAVAAALAIIPYVVSSTLQRAKLIALLRNRYSD